MENRYNRLFNGFDGLYEHNEDISRLVSEMNRPQMFVGVGMGRMF
jgi:hypothetical protein